ncbi:MAG: VanZ family protein [Bacillus subtilis]|nr:VanZ family protein [Bacillus subtilis]
MKHASWIISILLTIFVLSFSAQPASESGALSSSIVASFVDWLEGLFPRWDIDVDLLHTLVRKGAHVASFVVLGASWIVSFHLTGIRFLPYILLGIALSLIGEGIQWFAVGRGPSLIDSLVFNLPGYLLGGWIVFHVFYRPKEKRVA